MINTVIFDMDGVIFDTEALFLSCWREVGLKYGIEGIEQVALKCIGVTNNKTQEIISEYYGEDFDYPFYRNELSKAFSENLMKNGMPMKPGVYELMDYLKEKGYKIGLASSTIKDKVEEELEMAGLRKYFDAIVCGDMVSKSKPEPDIFLECARQLGVLPEEVYVIEDSYNGIRAASRAKMHPIMVPDLLEPIPEIIELSDEILHDLHEVKQYLANFNLI